MKQRIALLRTAMLAAGACVCLPAYAQSQVPADAGTPTASADSSLEEIIVTARRRAESIQDVPVAVTAISPAALEATAAPDISDLEGLTPNLVIDPVAAGPSAAAISIRGISFEDIEKSFDPAVGVLIDGVYLGTNTGQLLDFFDFESIEVLRGPQGTLFGRNTTAGVINIQRSRPTGELGVRALATVGNYGRQDLRAVVNLPSLGDILATKLFLLHNETSGHYRNQTLGGRYGGRNFDNFGVTFRLTPSDKLAVNLTYEHVDEESEIDIASLSQTGLDLICLALPLGPGGALVRPTGIPAAQCNRSKDDVYTTFTNVPGLARNNLDAVSAQIDWTLGDFTLTSVTGYRDSKESTRQDFDAASIDFFDTFRPQTYDQLTQELRLAGQLTTAVDVVAGVFYFDSEYRLRQRTRFGTFLQTAGGLPQVILADTDHSSKSTAVFGDVNWRLTDALRVSVGARYTWDDKRIRNAVRVQLPVVGVVPVFDVGAEEDWSEFTPRASVDYSFTDDHLVYASYARGYRSGGFNGRAQTATSVTQPYEPETVDSYEVGAKTQWMDGRLTFNLAAFYTKYDDKQEEVVVTAPPPSGQETLVQNAASATIKGLEAELSARPTERLTIGASLGLLDAEYDRYTTLARRTQMSPLEPRDLSTLNLRRTPDVSGSARFDYALPTEVGEFVLTGSYRYIDPYDTTIVPAPGTGFAGAAAATNDPRGRTDGQNIVDASLAWTLETAGGKIRASVFGRNLLDDRGINSTLPVAGLFTFAGARPPRTYGVEFGFEF
jgi:iron complex outermembrane recepter protein